MTIMQAVIPILATITNIEEAAISTEITLEIQTPVLMGLHH